MGACETGPWYKTGYKRIRKQGGFLVLMTLLFKGFYSLHVEEVCYGLTKWSIASCLIYNNGSSVIRLSSFPRLCLIPSLFH